MVIASDRRARTTVKLLRSEGKQGLDRRVFREVTKGADVFKGMEDVRSASWVDIDEDVSVTGLLVGVSSVLRLTCG